MDPNQNGSSGQTSGLKTSLKISEKHRSNVESDKERILMVANCQKTPIWGVFIFPFSYSRICFNAFFPI